MLTPASACAAAEPAAAAGWPRAAATTAATAGEGWLAGVASLVAALPLSGWLSTPAAMLSGKLASGERAGAGLRPSAAAAYLPCAQGGEEAQVVVRDKAWYKTAEPGKAPQQP